jgi:hypothetical protein
MKQIFFVLSIILLVSGCASNSGVMPIGKDSFMVSRQAASGFSGMGTLKAEAFQEGNEYCESKGKIFQVISTQDASPPYIFGNFPKSEVQFRCLDKGDPEIGRPMLKPTPNVRIENGVAENNHIQAKDSGAMYDELKKLKDLLDSNVITQDEFGTQKKKIFAKYN